MRVHKLASLLFVVVVVALFVAGCAGKNRYQSTPPNSGETQTPVAPSGQTGAAPQETSSGAPSTQKTSSFTDDDIVADEPADEEQPDIDSI